MNAIFALLITVYAGNIYVPQNVPTIQIAIDVAQLGDVIILEPGTYYESIHFGGKKITIQSEDPLDQLVVNSTIIDGLGLGAVVTFAGNEDNFTKLRGITIENGQVGINVRNAKPLIEYCLIQNNSGYGLLDFGGQLFHSTVKNNGSVGVYGSVSVPMEIYSSEIIGNYYEGVQVRVSAGPNVVSVLRDSIFRNNYSGVFIYNNNGAVSTVEIIDCVSSNNSYNGISGYSSTKTTISRCLISGNKDNGIYLPGNATGLIENSIIAGNRASGITNTGSLIQILNCTVVNNRTGLNSVVGVIKHVILWGNVTSIQNSSTPISSGMVNPLLVSSGFWNQDNTIWTDGDYHLSPDSPYINIGDPNYLTDPTAPTTDYDGNPRVVGSRIDIGAYEFQNNCQGDDFDDDGIADLCDKDSDNDGITNSYDVCDFTPATDEIDSDGRSRGDLNQDCIVDLQDFSIFQRAFTP